MKDKKHVKNIVLFLFLFPAMIWGQKTAIIKGFVKDSKNRSIEDVSVKFNNIGTSTNKKGYYEIWAKAIDSKGIAQPMLLPGWNPKGYLNNACHRIAVKIV